MNTYFATCQTAEEVKIEYRRLCKLWHPDLGQAEEREERTRRMQEINIEYAQASAVFRGEELRERARQKGKPAPTTDDFADAAAVDERIRQAIERVITIDGLEIEICGLWVWIGGETKPHRQALKEAGYRWSPNKEKWYFAGVPAGGWSSMDMEEIRTRYGSRHVSGRATSRRDVPIVADER